MAKDHDISTVACNILIWGHELRLCVLGVGRYPEAECRLMLDSLTTEFDELVELEKQGGTTDE